VFAFYSPFFVHKKTFCCDPLSLENTRVNVTHEELTRNFKFLRISSLCIPLTTEIQLRRITGPHISYELVTQFCFVFIRVPPAERRWRGSGSSSSAAAAAAAARRQCRRWGSGSGSGSGLGCTGVASATVNTNHRAVMSHHHDSNCGHNRRLTMTSDGDP